MDRATVGPIAALEPQARPIAQSAHRLAVSLVFAASGNRRKCVGTHTMCVFARTRPADAATFELCGVSQASDRVPCDHCCRSAAIGSSLDARCAGKYAAMSAIDSSSPVANASVSGSCGATP
jgi:hypothetical protein